MLKMEGRRKVDRSTAIDEGISLAKRVGNRRVWIMAIFGATAAIIFTFIIFFAMLDHVAGKDYLELGNEQVISLKYIVGKRDVNKYELKNEGGKTEYRITYKQGSVSGKDAELYEAGLMSEGYAVVHDGMDLNYREGSVTVGKDADDGKHVMLVMISRYNDVVSVQYRWLTGSLGTDYSKSRN